VIGVTTRARKAGRSKNVLNAASVSFSRTAGVGENQGDLRQNNTPGAALLSDFVEGQGGNWGVQLQTWCSAGGRTKKSNAEYNCKDRKPYKGESRGKRPEGGILPIHKSKCERKAEKMKLPSV